MINSKLELESQSHIMAHPYITRQEAFDDFNRQQKTTGHFSVSQCAGNEDQQGRLIRSSSTSQISTASEFDSKNRAPPRRRIQVAVCNSLRHWYDSLDLSLIGISVVVAANARSSVVEILEMVRGVQIAEAPVPLIVNSCG